MGLLSTLIAWHQADPPDAPATTCSAGPGRPQPGQQNSAEPRCQIASMACPRQFDLRTQRIAKRPGQHGTAVLAALALANDQFISREVDVLDAQSQAFHQAQAAAIQQARHQRFPPMHRCQQRRRLRPRQHHRQPRRTLGPHDVLHPRQVLRQHLPVEEQQCRKRLVLRTGRYTAACCQGAEETFHVRTAQFTRIAQMVVANIAANPVQTGLFRTQTVMLQPQSLANFVQQPGALRACPCALYHDIGNCLRHWAAAMRDNAHIFRMRKSIRIGGSH